jgi:hypothetical protein
MSQYNHYSQKFTNSEAQSASRLTEWKWRASDDQDEQTFSLNENSSKDRSTKKRWWKNGYKFNRKTTRNNCWMIAKKYKENRGTKIRDAWAAASRRHSSLHAALVSGKIEHRLNQRRASLNGPDCLKKASFSGVSRAKSHSGKGPLGLHLYLF